MQTNVTTPSQQYSSKFQSSSSEPIQVKFNTEILCKEFIHNENLNTDINLTRKINRRNCKSDYILDLNDKILKLHQKFDQCLKKSSKMQNELLSKKCTLIKKERKYNKKSYNEKLHRKKMQNKIFMQNENKLVKSYFTERQHKIAETKRIIQGKRLESTSKSLLNKTNKINKLSLFTLKIKAEKNEKKEKFKSMKSKILYENRSKVKKILAKVDLNSNNKFYLNDLKRKKLENEISELTVKIRKQIEFNASLVKSISDTENAIEKIGHKNPL